MRILSRYFLVSYLNLFILILIGSTIAIVVIEMMLNFDDILEDREGGRNIATYLFLRVPAYYLRDLFPVTSFAAVLFCLGLPARAHEITAIKSGGISPRRVVIPVLAAATLLSAVDLLLNESVVLAASRKWNRQGNSAGEITFRQGSFWYHRANAIYNIQEADEEDGTLGGVSVFELNPRGRLLRSIQAERVEVRDGTWRFFDVTQRVFDPSRPAAPPKTSRLREWDRVVATEKDLEMLEASARTLSLLNLNDYIEAQNREGRDTTRYQALYHSRLAEPLTVLIFALIAIPLGLSVESSRSLATASLYGVVALGVFYTARTTAGLFATGGFASAIISPWLILVGFGGYGVWQLNRISR